MGIITLHNIRTYSYHGCLEEEAVIGGNYSVDVKIKTDFRKAEASDKLNDTIDYCQVYDIVKREMMIRSKLIEHVGRRIVVALKNEIKSIQNVKVRIKKIAPPMNGDVEAVSVVV